MQYIWKIDRNKLGKYKNKIITDDVILTNERKLHIFKNHKKDYRIIMNNIYKVVVNPMEILENPKNKETLLFIGRLNSNNLNVVVKLNTTNDKIHTQNSVMTAWIIRESNLRKLRRKSKSIYKNE